MKDASDYLTYIKALIVMNPEVLHWTVLREEAQGDMGMLRFRLTLRDRSLLEMFEFFHVIKGKVQVIKYSFHWQDISGHLVKRWDNSAHHPELSTNPHHVHDGAEGNVKPHRLIRAEEVIELVGTGPTE